MTSPASLEELRRLASAATPGRACNPMAMHGESLLAIGESGPGKTGRSLQMRTVDAEFHAAANPVAT